MAEMNVTASGRAGSATCPIRGTEDLSVLHSVAMASKAQIFDLLAIQPPDGPSVIEHFYGHYGVVVNQPEKERFC